MLSNEAKKIIKTIEPKVVDKIQKYQNRSYKECCRQIVSMLKTDINYIELIYRDKGHNSSFAKTNDYEEIIYVSAAYICNAYKSSLKYDRLIELYEEFRNWKLVISYISTILKGLVKSIDELEKQYE